MKNLTRQASISFSEGRIEFYHRVKWWQVWRWGKSGPDYVSRMNVQSIVFDLDYGGGV